jgi:hypothetical protein
MGVKEGTVHLNLEDCQVTRLADEPRNALGTQKLTQRIHNATSAEGGLGANVAINPSGAGANIRGRGRLSAKSTNSTERIVKSEMQVVAILSTGTDKQPSWPVRRIPGEEALEGRYFGTDSLYNIGCNGAPFRITATFMCLPYDIVVKDVNRLRGKIFNWCTNKEAIVRILVSQLTRTRRGCVLCKSELEKYEEPKLN